MILVRTVSKLTRLSETESEELPITIDKSRMIGTCPNENDLIMVFNKGRSVLIT